MKGGINKPAGEKASLTHQLTNESAKLSLSRGPLLQIKNRKTTAIQCAATA